MAECETCGQELPEMDDGSSDLLTCMDCGVVGAASEGYVNDGGYWRCDSCMDEVM